MKKTTLITTLAFFLILLSACSSNETQTNTDIVSTLDFDKQDVPMPIEDKKKQQEVIKKHQDKVDKRTEKQLIAQQEPQEYIVKLSGSSSKKTRSVKVKDTPETVVALLQSADVEFVEADQPISLFSTSLHTVTEVVKATTAWNTTQGEGVKIAVLDTGIAPVIPTTGGHAIVGVDYGDTHGHGTSVSSIVHAIAPNASLFSVKIFENGQGMLSDALSGVQWAIDNEMDLIIMSFGFDSYSQLLKETLNQAYAQGIVIVGASGNGGTISYPAKYETVVAVGAVNESLEITSFSSTGSEQELVALGKDVHVLGLNGEQVISSGTSMSAPQVTGVIALLQSANSSLTPDQIREKLAKDAVDLGSEGKDDTYGHGFVQAEVTSFDVTPLPVLPYEFTVFNITNYGLDNESYVFWMSSVGFIEEVSFSQGYYLINKTLENGAIISEQIYVDENQTLTLLQDYIVLIDDYTIACPTANCENDGFVWVDGSLEFEIFESDHTILAECVDRRDDGFFDECYGTSSKIDDCRDDSTFEQACKEAGGSSCSSSGSVGRHELSTASARERELDTLICYRHRSEYKSNGQDDTPYFVCNKRQYQCVNDNQYQDRCYVHNNHQPIATVTCDPGYYCDATADGALADFGPDGVDVPRTPCRPMVQIVNITPLTTGTVFENDIVRFNVTVINNGPVALSRFIEGAVVPADWQGDLVPEIQTLDVRDNPLAVCPDNKYYDSKIIDALQPGETITVSFTIRAPNSSAVDSCDPSSSKRSAWSSTGEFIVLSGTYLELSGGAYEEFSALPFSVQERVGECIVDDDCGTQETGDLYCHQGHVTRDRKLNLCVDNVCLTAPKTKTHCAAGCSEESGSATCLAPTECSYLDGSSYECECHSTADCQEGFYCNQRSGPNACEPVQEEDQCSNYHDYFCEQGKVLHCKDLNGRFVKDEVQDCNRAHLYCDPLVVDGTAACSEFLHDTQVWLDHAKGVRVKKQPGDVIVVNAYSDVEQILNVNVHSGLVENINCPSQWSVQDHQTCIMRVRPDATVNTATAITVGQKSITFEIMDAPSFVVLTHSENLYKRYPFETTGVDAVLSQAYENAQDGVLYDLSLYDLGVAHPFNSFEKYNEQVERTTLSDNGYSLAIAEFVQEKCTACTDVMIVGDDFVVPYYRREISTLTKHFFFFDHKETKDLYTDIPYQRKALREFVDFFEMFSLEGEFEGKSVTLVLPNNLNSEMRNQIDEFKTSLEAQGYNPDFKEINGQDTHCVDESWISSVRGETLVIIGTEENNNAFACMPFVSGNTNRNTTFIQPNVWDNEEYALVVNTEDSRVLEALNQLINSGSIVELKGHSAYMFHVGTEYVGYATLGVGVLALSIGSGGTIPAAVLAGAGTLSLIADSADVADTCVVNPDGIAWCAGAIGIAAIPGPSAPVKDQLQELSRKNPKWFEIFEPVDSEITTYFKSLKESDAIGKDALNSVLKTPQDNVHMAKGAKKLIGEEDIEEGLSKIKFHGNPTDPAKEIRQLQRVTYIRAVGKAELEISKIADPVQRDRLSQKLDQLIHLQQNQKFQHAKGERGEIESLFFEDFDNIKDIRYFLGETELNKLREVLNEPALTNLEFDILRKDLSIVESKFIRNEEIFASKIIEQGKRHLAFHDHHNVKASITFRQKHDYPISTQEEANNLLSEKVKQPIRDLRIQANRDNINIEIIDAQGNLFEVDI